MEWYNVLVAASVASIPIICIVLYTYLYVAVVDNSFQNILCQEWFYVYEAMYIDTIWCVHKDIFFPLQEILGTSVLTGQYKKFVDIFVTQE